MVSKVEDPNSMTKQVEEWLQAEDYPKILKFCNQSKSKLLSDDDL